MHPALESCDIVGFDVDGTLVESFTPEVLPGVSERLQELAAAGKGLFVATNQGGPFWRALTKQEKFPDVPRLVANLSTIALATGLERVPWLVAVHPGAKHATGRKEQIVPRVQHQLEGALMKDGTLEDVRVSRALDWRKPEDGMLRAGLELLGGGRLAYVGDLDSDRQAAEAAGAVFLDASDFRAG